MGPLLFLYISIHLTSAVSHSLRYISTAITPGTSFPQYSVVGLVDGEALMYYDSNIKKMTPRTEQLWESMGEDFWKTESDLFEAEQKWSLFNMDLTMKRHNNTEGIHTWQWTYGCELHDNGTTTAYSKFAYDGHDYIRLDLNTGTFTAPQKSFLLNWNEALAGHCKDYLKTECIEELEKFVGYSRSSQKRRVPPEVSLFQKDSSSPMVCHATGFFPKAVKISWLKNGEDLDEDVEIRETLPNQDGTFQKRSILTVSPEELDRNQYTCIIQHGSLEVGMVLHVSDHRLTSGGRVVGVFVGGVMAVFLLVLVSIVGLYIRKKDTPDVQASNLTQGPQTHPLIETSLNSTRPQSSC